MSSISEITPDDIGKRVSYQFLGRGEVRLYGEVVRPARSWKYGPGAMILWDDRKKHQFAYLRDLKFTDVPKTPLTWNVLYSILLASRTERLSPE